LNSKALSIDIRAARVSKRFQLTARSRSRLCCGGLAVLGLLALVGCRQDMHNQPKFIPLREATFYHDLRSERPPVPGTIARGHLRIDEVFYTGKENGQPVDFFPFPVTKEVLKRGEERFNIYCSPCHGRLGNGEGMIVQRGLRRAANFHSEALRAAPVGHFFDVMTNGFGVMPSYAYRIHPRDRWAVAAYIRALQLSQHAGPADVPASEVGKPTGATK